MIRRLARFGFGLVVLLLALTTVAVRTTTGSEGVTWSWGYLLVIALLVILGLAVVIGVSDLVRSLGGRDPQADAIAARMVARPEQQHLVTRWLRRSRWYRNVGGVAGVVAGFVVAGPGGMVLLGLLGLTLGSLTAELHLLGPDRPDDSGGQGARAAGLERRSLSHYWEPWRQLALGLTGLAAVALMVLDSFDKLGAGPGADLAAAWAVAAAAAVGAAGAIQWRVATRPRPALPQALRSSDDLVRSLAVTNGIANPTLSLALAFLAMALSDLSPSLSVMSWLAALALFWRFRRLGFDHLLDEPPLTSTAAVA